MAKWFDGIKSLENHMLNVALAKAQTDMTGIIAGKLGIIMAEKFYGTYSPSVYQRSYDLFNSITVVEAKVKNGKVITSVYLDPDKLKETTFTDRDGRKYIRHAWHDKQGIINATAGISGGGMERFYMPVDNYGLPYVMPSSMPSTDGSYWFDFVDFVKHEGINIFREELKKQGLNVN